MKALTKEQQDFATKNHNLVYAFLHHKHLNVDDFYDVVIFRYMRAVQRYLEEPYLQKYHFSTIAYSNMNSAVHHHWAAMKRKKRTAKIISFDRSYRLAAYCHM